MPEVFEISDQLSRRFSSGCIMCGKLPTWRVKVLDPQNLPLEICIDCLLRQKVIKPKEGEYAKKEISEGKRMEEPEPSPDRSKDEEQPVEGEEPAVGDEPKNDVERQKM